MRAVETLSSIQGLTRLTKISRVIITPVPTEYDSLDRRELLLSPWLWSSCLEDKVLVFDGTSALCGNSPYTVLDFVEFDWVGAAWKWAKKGSAHEWGGNGALSLRNRTLIVYILNQHIESVTSGKAKGYQGENARTERRFAVFKGNEDMWFVKKLFDLDKAMGIRLANKSVSMKWAVEELFDEDQPLPLGVYHVMRSLPNKLRTKVIKSCPETKRLFEVTHEVHKT